jgi:hypothetical protein
MMLDAPVGATGPILILLPRRIGDVRRFDVFGLDGYGASMSSGSTAGVPGLGTTNAF